MKQTDSAWSSSYILPVVLLDLLKIPNADHPETFGMD